MLCPLDKYKLYLKFDLFLTVEIDENKSKIFFSIEAQMLMKQLTGFDLDKIYRKRTTGDRIKDPKIEFLTTNQLKQVSRFYVSNSF